MKILNTYGDVSISFPLLRKFEEQGNWTVHKLNKELELIIPMIKINRWKILAKKSHLERILKSEIELWSQVFYFDPNKDTGVDYYSDHVVSTEGKVKDLVSGKEINGVVNELTGSIEVELCGNVLDLQRLILSSFCKDLGKDVVYNKLTPISFKPDSIKLIELKWSADQNKKFIRNPYLGYLLYWKLTGSFSYIKTRKELRGAGISKTKMNDFINAGGDEVLEISRMDNRMFPIEAKKCSLPELDMLKHKFPRVRNETT